MVLWNLPNSSLPSQDLDGKSWSRIDVIGNINFWINFLFSNFWTYQTEEKLFVNRTVILLLSPNTLYSVLL